MMRDSLVASIRARARLARIAGTARQPLSMEEIASEIDVAAELHGDVVEGATTGPDRDRQGNRLEVQERDGRSQRRKCRSETGLDYYVAGDHGPPLTSRRRLQPEVVRDLVDGHVAPRQHVVDPATDPIQRRDVVRLLHGPAPRHERSRRDPCSAVQPRPLGLGRRASRSARCSRRGSPGGGRPRGRSRWPGRTGSIGRDVGSPGSGA